MTSQPADPDKLGKLDRQRADVWCFADLPYTVQYRLFGVGVATGAVLAQWLGLGVKQAEVRQTHRGPELFFIPGPGDAQHCAVTLLGVAHAFAPAAEQQGYTSPELWCCLSQCVALRPKLAVEDIARRGFHVDWPRAVHDANRLRTQTSIATAITEAAQVLCAHRQLSSEQVSKLLLRHGPPDRLTPPVWTPPHGEVPTSPQPDAVRDIMARGRSPELEQLFSRMQDVQKDMQELIERFKRLEGRDDT